MPQSSPIADEFERRLELEGLAPIDLGPGGALVPHPRSPACDDRAVSLYLGWARSVLETHGFDGTRQRRVWELYAAGRTYSEIARTLNVNRRAVTRAVAEVQLAVPPPVANPWRKSGREDAAAPGIAGAALKSDAQVTGRLLSLALACVPDLCRFRAMVARDSELMRRLPQGGRLFMAKTKAQVTKVRYTRILLKSPIDVPGKRVRHERFLDVDGRPHAGGIDVDLDAVVVTVPWGQIVQAERKAPEAMP